MLLLFLFAASAALCALHHPITARVLTATYVGLIVAAANPKLCSVVWTYAIQLLACLLAGQCLRAWLLGSRLQFAYTRQTHSEKPTVTHCA